MDGMAGFEARLPERATLQAALEGVADAVMLVDETPRVCLVNDAALRLLDLAPAARTGRASLATVLRRAAALDEDGREQIATAVRNGLAVRAGSEVTIALRSGAVATLAVQQIARRRWRLAFRPVATVGASRRGRRDPLTGLPDRQALRARLSRALDCGSATLLMLDLDRFKAVNDTLGHPIGDLLLAAAADRMREAVRARDLAARLGGDEFAFVLQEGTGVVQATALAGRLIDLLARPYLLKGNLVSTGASIGIAAAPAGFRNPDELIRRADLALYQAKADGRGVARVFDPVMNERAQSRSALEADLRRAVAMREFTLHYQPQYDMGRDAVAGFEALLRWPHATRGMVSPMEFIPVAEEIGLIVPIGAWVLQRACADAATWSQPLSVAVNVSPLQFERGEDLVASVQTALIRSGLPAQRLEIEITESALLSAEVSTLATLNALRALGVRVSLDDFGTGYSSLSQLRSFPFDKIKIDRSFVNDVARSAQASAIIRAISTLGDSLGMATIAEGVETAEQAHAIALNGCNDIQGYLISRPIPMADIEALLTRYGAPQDGRRADTTASPDPTKEPSPCPTCIGSSTAAAVA